MYGNVNNIDLWIGALSEDHVAGTDVGPLMLAGLLDQFTRLRDGDRLWFTNDSGLTSAELSQVENVTLAGIIEANTGLTNLQANVFLAAVPEPAGWELAAIGFLGMACYRHKVRSKKVRMLTPVGLSTAPIANQFKRVGDDSAPRTTSPALCNTTTPATHTT